MTAASDRPLSEMQRRALAALLDLEPGWYGLGMLANGLRICGMRLGVDYGAARELLHQLVALGALAHRHRANVSDVLFVDAADLRRRWPELDGVDVTPTINARPWAREERNHAANPNARRAASPAGDRRRDAHADRADGRARGATGG